MVKLAAIYKELLVSQSLTLVEWCSNKTLYSCTQLAQNARTSAFIESLVRRRIKQKLRKS